MMYESLSILLKFQIRKSVLKANMSGHTMSAIQHEASQDRIIRCNKIGIEWKRDTMER